MASGPGRQLTLPVQLRHDASLEHFFETPNHQLVLALKDALSDSSETLIYLSGAKESGKTHLCSAAVLEIERQGKTAGYFSMTDLVDVDEAEIEQDLIDAMSGFDLVVLENIDRWLRPGVRELILFNLFNQFKISGQQLLVTARTSPANLSVDLPDLRSRLLSGLTLTLSTLSDEDKQSMLRSAAMARGLKMNEDVSLFIIRRSGRNMGQLFSVLDVLDRASLTEQRGLTIPFVKKVMEW